MVIGILKTILTQQSNPICGEVAGLFEIDHELRTRMLLRTT